jgi:hypothetical protein
MKYVVEVSSGAMIYIPSFIKTGSAVQKLIAWDTEAYRQHSDLIILLLFIFFFKIRKRYWFLLYFSYEFLRLHYVCRGESKNVINID